MNDVYLRTVATNLAHLRTLVPEQPKRNLASNATSLPMTEDDVVLNRQIKWGSIPEGRAGTYRTMQTMAALARQAATDPVFIKFARQFSGIDDLESWMRDHFTYRDEHEELIRTPRFMLEDMGRIAGPRVVGLEGDCDDAATFLSAAAKVLGYPARLVAIRYNAANPDFEHVFAQACANGEWVTLDPTVDVNTTIQSVEDMIVAV
jgi:transglutaminase-like putative cysteine protease